MGRARQVTHFAQLSRQFPDRRQQGHRPPRELRNSDRSVQGQTQLLPQRVERKGMSFKWHIFEAGECVTALCQSSGGARPVGEIGVGLHHVGGSHRLQSPLRNPRKGHCAHDVAVMVGIDEIARPQHDRPHTGGAIGGFHLDPDPTLAAAGSLACGF